MILFRSLIGFSFSNLQTAHLDNPLGYRRTLAVKKSGHIHSFNLYSLMVE